MRKKIFAGNWKMNHGLEASASFVENFVGQFEQYNPSKEVEYIVFAQSACLPRIRESWEKAQSQASGWKLHWGPQNVYWEESGAFTGEMSLSLAKELHCAYALAGHSERRQFFGETNETAAKRSMATVKAGLKSIFCIGENLAERESDRTFDVLKEQCKAMFAESLEGPKGLVIAYEPVWAIGTGKTATAAQAEEVHKFLRGFLAETWGNSYAEQLPILYGGSVKPANVAELMACENVDGALVGGASLKADGFLELAKNGS